MQAKDVTVGTQVIVNVDGRRYPVKVKDITRQNGMTVLWYRSIDKWAKGDDCSFYEDSEQVTLA